VADEVLPRVTELTPSSTLVRMPSPGPLLTTLSSATTVTLPAPTVVAWMPFGSQPLGSPQLMPDTPLGPTPVVFDWIAPSSRVTNTLPPLAKASMPSPLDEEMVSPFSVVTVTLPPPKVWA